MKNALPRLTTANLVVRAVFGLVIGVALALGVGWVKLAVADKPAYRTSLQSCFRDPACDPSPYINMGWPFPYGVNNDASGSLRVMSLSNAPEEYDGGVYTDDYWGFVGDTLIFGLLAFASLTVRLLIQRLSGRRRRG